MTTDVSARRLLGILLVAALPFAAGCGAGKGNETDKERSTPYAAAGDAGSMAVRAARLIPAGASATTEGAAQAYLTLALVNRGTAADSLINATVAGGAVHPGGATSSLTVEPHHRLNFGAPDLGDTGPTLEVTGLSSPLTYGTALAVTLTFKTGGTVTMDVPVLDPEYVGTTATAAPVETTGSYPSASPEPTEP